MWQGLLELPVVRHHLLWGAGIALHFQQQVDGFGQGAKAGRPLRHFLLARMAVLVLPSVVGGQVKTAGAARNTRTAADAHEPFVFGQSLACFAGQADQAANAVVHLRDDFIQHRFGNRGVAAVTVEYVLLFFQVLQHIRLQVCTRTHIHDLENGGESVVVLQCLLAGEQVAQALEQLLQSQVGPDAFVKGVFVQDHAAGFLSCRIIARSAARLQPLRSVMCPAVSGR